MSTEPTPAHPQWARVGVKATAIHYRQNRATSVRTGEVTRLLARDIVVTFSDGSEERWSNRNVVGGSYNRPQGAWSEYTDKLTTDPRTISAATNYVRSVRAGRSVRSAFTNFEAANNPQTALETLDALIAAAQAARAPIAKAAVNTTE